MIIKETGDILPVFICLVHLCSAYLFQPILSLTILLQQVRLEEKSLLSSSRTTQDLQVKIQHHDLPLCRRGCRISFNIHIFLNLLEQNYRKDLCFVAERCTGGHLGN